MQSKGKTGISRLMAAAIYSIKGLRGAWRHEAAFRQELLLAIILGPLALWIGDSLTQKALLIFCVWVVLIVELINSAIESVVDRIGPEQHPLSGQAKDLGSAAVFISLCGAILVWVFVIMDCL